MFRGYCLRFGHVVAGFVSAGMLELVGRCEALKGPRLATLNYYTREQLTAKVRDNKRNDLNWQYLQDVLDEWPDNVIGLTASMFPK